MQKKEPPKGTQPFFFTNNQVLATALACAGIEFLDGEACRVEYDADYLAKHGCKTISEARAKRKPGKFVHLFKSDGDLADCLKAFDALNKKLDAQIQAGQPLDFLENLPPRVRAEAALTVIRVYQLVKESPYKVVPWLRYWDDGEQEFRETADGGVTSFPASKLVPMNASEAVKERMGL